jgi:hypothetical protein
VLDKTTRAAMVRRYASNAHKGYTAKLENLRTILADRPMELDGDHFVDFYAARALYSLYEGSLALDAVGNSAYNDDKVLDRIRDTRKAQIDWILTSKLANSGIYGLTQQIAENAARNFIAQAAIAESD